jgi:hypothetical protein
MDISRIEHMALHVCSCVDVRNAAAHIYRRNRLKKIYDLLYDLTLILMN